jgi:serine/threonine-protein kinase
MSTLHRLRPLLLLAFSLAACGSGGAGSSDLGMANGDGAGGPLDGGANDLAMGGGGDGGAQGPNGFPTTAPWYQDISGAGTASDSPTIIANLATVGWGTLKIDVSFYINHADASVARRSYTTNGSYYSPDCDLAPVPVPMGGAIENYPINGYTCGGGDCHLLVYQGTRLYELSVANITGGQYNGSPFTGGCLAIWDLTRDYWVAGSNPYSRGDQCTSADAAGFPMAPLLLTAAELSAGKIEHALRFTLDNTLIRDSVYVHPATHGTSSPNGASGGANTMPYGSRLRLKAGSYPAIGAQGQIIVKALQTYGMFMADGGNLYVSGTSDLGGVISNSAISSLGPNDFEVLDSGSPINWNGNCARTPLTN